MKERYYFSSNYLNQQGTFIFFTFAHKNLILSLDNRALPINRKQKVFPNGTLIIENVERNSDQATYTCVAKNQEGYSARGSLEVQVMGKLKIILFPEFPRIWECSGRSYFLGWVLTFQPHRWSSIVLLSIEYPNLSLSSTAGRTL